MALGDSLFEVYDKISELAKHIEQDNAEMDALLNSAAEVIRIGGTSGKLKEFKEHSDTMQAFCDDIETHVHQMEIYMLSINRRLHGANASIDSKLTKLYEHVRQGYLDFDEYEDTVE